MKKYVLCCPIDFTDKVLLTERQHPNWQKGRLNLVGGAVQNGEHSAEAAMRIFKAKTDCEFFDCDLAGKIQSNNFVINVFIGYVKDQEIVPVELIDEYIAWYHWPLYINKDKLIPNLNVAIPLCLTGMQNWSILMNNRQPTEYEMLVRVA